MGIRKLNKFLRQKCKTAIIRRYIEELQNKTLVIDISIYLYKFKGLEMLREKMYIMCSLFHKHNINAIFVFDGKATEMKQEELNDRKVKKEKAEAQYNTVKKKLETEQDELKKEEMEQKLLNLKKQFIYITKEDTNIVKDIITGFGLHYVNSVREADELCVLLCKDDSVYGCVSDDMDMFAYGCKRVIRYFNLTTQTCFEYDMKNILTKLNIDMKMFRKLCVLSGCDYNKAYNLYLYPFEMSYNKLGDFVKSSSENIYSFIYNNEQHRENAETIERQFELDDVETIYSKQDIDTFIKEFTEKKAPNKVTLQYALKDANYYFV